MAAGFPDGQRARAARPVPPPNWHRQVAGSTSRLGRTTRPPRNYRGRDFCWWLGLLGKWGVSAPLLGAERVTIAVSGAQGGYAVASGSWVDGSKERFKALEIDWPSCNATFAGCSENASSGSTVASCRDVLDKQKRSVKVPGEQAIGQVSTGLVRCAANASQRTSRAATPAIPGTALRFVPDPFTPGRQLLRSRRATRAQRWLRFGPSCSSSTASGAKTTSSSWAVTPGSQAGRWLADDAVVRQPNRGRGGASLARIA
jgi:hypothetical protein